VTQRAVGVARVLEAGMEGYFTFPNDFTIPSNFTIPRRSATRREAVMKGVMKGSMKGVMKGGHAP
jgi:hypothetical protein